MGTNLSSPEKGTEPPIFGSFLLWPNDWMHQDGTWHGGRSWSSPHCARGRHSSPPHLTQSRLGRGRAPYQVAFWCMQPFGHNRNGPKIGEGGCAPLGEAELCPHLTQRGHGRGLPACQVSSWSVQPFGHNTPTPQTGQTGQRTDSIGRTVLQTVAQKPLESDISSMCRHAPT